MSNNTIAFLEISCIIISMFSDSVFVSRGTVRKAKNHPKGMVLEEDKNMKNGKKFAALLLSAALVTACAACGNDSESGEAVGNVETSEEVSNSGSEASEESSEASEESSEESSETSDESSEESQEASDESGAEGQAAGDVLNYADYMAAEMDSQVVVETYVQAKQSWWEDKATVYTQDQDGGYFVYNMACSEEDYAKLTPGTKIKVTGYKGEWSGEIEIMDASFEFVEGGDTFVAEPKDVTAYLGKDELVDYQNQFVSFKGMTVEAAGQDADGNDVAFLYNWDGSGAEGDDLYFQVSLDGQTYTFTVESYLCDKDSEVYGAVKALNIGDKIDMEGFLYWYEGVNPHITSVKAAE